VSAAFRNAPVGAKSREFWEKSLMAKTTYQIDQYVLDDARQFVRISQTFCGTKTAGMPKHDPTETRKTFTVVHNLNSGSICIEQATGSLADCDRLQKFLISGKPPDECDSHATSRYFIVETGNWAYPSMLFVARNEYSPTQWTELLDGARARYQYIADLTTDARLQTLERDEQLAFGFGMSSYLVWHFAQRNIDHVPHSSKKLYKEKP
jgi:hypothetical protein